jgi:hypothetical protein
MKNATVLPFVQKTMRSHPVLVNVATAATGLMRQMAIKPFTPRERRRELSLRERVPSLHALRCQIFKEKGSGNIPTIVIGGFVPDATEVAEFQRPLFKSYGSIYYLNYPRHGFDQELFFAQLSDLIEDLNLRGKKPVIFSISFGCGLLARFLQTVLPMEQLAIRGVVMVSPVLCTADLIRPEQDKSGGVRMIESNLKRILKADAGNGDDVKRQIERARRCFQSLFEAGAENRKLSSRHLSIRRKIMDVIEKTPATGGYERVLALKTLDKPDPESPLFSGPALTLLAEMEDNLLAPTSPTLATLRDRSNRERMFPRGTFRTVTASAEDDAVAHASLIFHHQDYNPLIEAWYGRFLSPKLFEAI